jgi:hypothetical protein
LRFTSERRFEVVFRLRPLDVRHLISPFDHGAAIYGRASRLERSRESGY